MTIIKATAADDAILARHYLAVWESYGTPPEQLLPDAAQNIRAFIADGREACELGAFIAYADGRAAGSVACQLYRSPYPDVIKREFRKFGYVWSVFVEAEHRGKGMARELMKHAIGHLEGIGCTTVVLHASDAGEPVYAKLGFQRSKEMRLPLREKTTD